MPTSPDNHESVTEEPSRSRTISLFVGTFIGVFVVFLIGTLLQYINLPFGLVGTSLFVFAAAGLWLPAIFNLQPVDFTGLRRFPVGLVLLGLLLGLANMGFANFIMGTMREAFPKSWSTMADAETLLLVRASPTARVVIVLAAGVAAPIGEELFFRGWLQGVLARRYSMATSIVLTAILFSATHLDRVGFLARVELGCLFGLLRATTGSIYPAMAAHGAHNLISTAALYLSKDPLAELNEPFPWGHAALVAVGSLAATVAVLYLLLRLAPRTHAREPEPLVVKNPRRPTFRLQPTILVAGLACVLVLIFASAAGLQSVHRRLPGYGLVPDPLDRPVPEPQPETP